MRINVYFRSIVLYYSELQFKDLSILKPKP